MKSLDLSNSKYLCTFTFLGLDSNSKKYNPITKYDIIAQIVHVGMPEKGVYKIFILKPVK